MTDFPGGPRPLDSSAATGAVDELQVIDSGPRLCFVVGKEAASSASLAGMLEASGAEARILAAGPAFAQALANRSPDFVFLDVDADPAEALGAVAMLGERSYAGYVQLIVRGPGEAAEAVLRAGEQRGLQMQPVLPKPLKPDTIRRLLQTSFESVTLSHALANDWVEFWYQPKIDLKRKQIAGVETFARVLHPRLGTLPPGTFMPGADDKSLAQLSERALVDALRAASNFSQVGINLRLAVNASINALTNLPIADLVSEYGPKKTNWPGLILDVTEEQIGNDLPLVRDLAGRLTASNIKLAIDDFGSGRIPISKLRDLPFAELKLDRNYVRDCGSDKSNAAVCKMVVDIAHDLGSVAVGIGIEKAAEVFALQTMGCDLGQGFLFGQPMPEEKLVALLRQRAASQTGDRAAAQA